MARINFDLPQLQAFVAVAERGSSRAAAEQIALSAPALSRRIEKLETILGARLFNRTTRDVELTPLGRVFLERACSGWQPATARHCTRRPECFMTICAGRLRPEPVCHAAGPDFGIKKAYCAYAACVSSY